MSEKDYGHWADKRDTWFQTMQLAEEEIEIVKKKYFIRWNIMGNVSKEQFDECNKEIQIIYDKYEIQVNREGINLNQNKDE
tara:strand:+ start:460 stop:702 length:243 start_codon:yes stop_codon:yes gene_type:complete